MSTQVVLPGKPLIAQQTLDGFPGAVSLVVTFHILLPNICIVTARPGTVNRSGMSSKMVAEFSLVTWAYAIKGSQDSLPLAILAEGLVAFGPIAKEYSISCKLATFQTSDGIFFEPCLAARF